MAVQADKIFVNLPVKDLNKSIAFFSAIGFAFNPQFTNENATCMIISEHNYAMLLVQPFFQTFTKKEIADATKTTEVLVALSLSSKEEVDELADKALAAGGSAYSEPMDHGFMYTRTFQDLDGHQWELFWMDPKAVNQ